MDKLGFRRQLPAISLLTRTGEAVWPKQPDEPQLPEPQPQRREPVPHPLNRGAYANKGDDMATTTTDLALQTS
mgnify:CR=1 FL=1